MKKKILQKINIEPSSPPTIIHKNNETNDKFYRKVAFLTYTESVKFRSQSRETASKRKPYRGLGTRYPSM